MAFFWSELSSSVYEDKRTRFIAEAEGYEFRPYLDTHTPPLPSIGIGFNLLDEKLQDKIINSIFYSDQVSDSFIGADGTFKDQIIAALNNTYSTSESLQSALDGVMSARNTYWTNAILANPGMDHPADIRSTFSYISIDEMRPVFDTAVAAKETSIDNWLAGIPSSSNERLVLLSLAYNGALAGSNNLKAAIQAGNRAEAWYEIRYNTNDGSLTTPDINDGHKGVAVRRYGESQMFGLYEGSKVPTDDDLREIFQMMTRHRDKIDQYDSRYGGFLNDAAAKFNFDVLSTERTISSAKDLLVTEYAAGHHIDRIWVDYAGVDGLGAETNNLDFSARTENALFLGGGGDDTIRAGSGNDVLYGESGTDKLYGNAGDDVLNGGGFGFGLEGDVLNGGVGQDAADYSTLSLYGINVVMLGTSGSVQGWNGAGTIGVGIDRLEMIEVVSGSALADRFTGGDVSVTFAGGAGSDLYDVVWGSALPRIIEKAGDAGIDAIRVPADVTPDTYESIAGSNGETVLRPQSGSGPIYTIAAGIENVIDPSGKQTPLPEFRPHEEPEPIGPYAPDVQTPFINGNNAHIGGGGADPLVLDLGAQGIVYTTGNGSGSVYWDIDNDGMREQVSWVGPEDGLLAFDRNGNGKIDSNSELFGDHPASGILNGFTTLKTLDSNGDNKITASDAQFGVLKVWVDANTDGISQSSELRSLSAAGITSINLNYNEIYNNAGDTLLRQESTFILNGTFRQVVDAWFTVNNFNTEYGGVYTLDPRTLTLPDLRGYGNLPDLRIAMSLNSGLLAMVQAVAAQGAAGLLDPAFHLQDKMTAILYAWAGVGGVDPASRGGLFDAQKFGVLEAFTGVTPTIPPAPINPLGVMSGQYDAAWNAVLGGVTGQLLVQAGLGGLYHNPVYDAVSDLYSGGDAQGNFRVHFNISTAQADYMVETAPNDIYVFHPGDIAALGNPYFILSQPVQSGDLILLSGVTPASVGVWFESNDYHSPMNIRLGTGEIIRVQLPIDIMSGAVLANNIPRIAFDDSTIWDFRNGMTLTDTNESHAFKGTDLKDTISGKGGDDYIMTYGGNDYITGGTGVDFLYGGMGDDTYVFRVGDSLAGQDVIIEAPGEGTDTIKLTGGILPGNVILTADYLAGFHIRYSANDDISVIGSIDNATEAFTSGIERVIFDNGTVWDFRNGITTSGSDSASEIHGTMLKDIINGNGGNDILYGAGNKDVLNGGAGNDTLYGGYDDDQYIYSAGTGQGSDVIRDDSGLADTIILGAGYTATNVSLVRVGQYDMAIKSGSQQLFLIQGQFDSGGSIETLKYGDGTTLNLMTYSHTTNGTVGDDSLYGTSFGAGGDKLNGQDGNDYIYAGTGNDTVTGGNGNDTIYGDDGNDTLSGNAGDDTVNSGLGDDTVIYDSGADIFSDMGGADVIKITNTAITAANMTLARPSGQYDLEILFNGLHAFTIENQFGEGQGFETVKFSNGTTFNLAGVQYTTNGTSGADSLHGIGFGGNINDIVKGNAGNDNIWAYQGNDNITGGTGNDIIDGGDGNDTYLYNAGDGVDFITDSSGTDLIQIGTGFVKTDLTWQRDGSTDSMILFLKNIQVMSLNGQFTVDHQIETVKFFDGTTQSLIGLQMTSNGTSGDDYIVGVTANASPNDIFKGNGGNDNLYGNEGNDTYLYNAGDGVDFISDSSGTDLIQLGSGFVKADLTWSRITGTDDLALSLKGAKVITIQSHFIDGYAVESVKFSDGSTYALTGLALTTNGSSGSDYLNGTNITNDTINGLAGDDGISGYSGNDTLVGGTGADILSGGAGDDTYVFKSGESPTVSPDRIYEYFGEGVDTIKLTGGILPADVLMWTDSSTLYIRYSANDQITIQAGYDPATGASLASSYIEKVIFDNGTVWDLRNGLNMNDTNDAHFIYGSLQNDIIDSKGGNDTVSGYAGNDTLTGGVGTDYLYGGAGDDTYVLKNGESPIVSPDKIYESIGDGVDTIKLTGGILPANVLMWTDSSNFYIRYSANDQITIQAGYDPATGASLASSYIEKVTFDNGTVWDLRNGLPMTDSNDSHTVIGSMMSDMIDGRGGDDTIYGYSGNDTIVGGSGTDIAYGGTGDDSYIFKVGDSSLLSPDSIFENSDEGLDTIKLTGGILPSNVLIWIENYETHIRYSPTDEIIIFAPYNGGSSPVPSPVEKIIFDNGTIWDLRSALTLTDTDDDHSIFGSDLNDVIDGKGGNDGIYGFSGNDILIGGTGSDSLYGGMGDDVYVFKAGDGLTGPDSISEISGEGVDTVKITGGILPGNVRMWLDYGGFHVRYSSDYQINMNNVEKISFDNGTIWDLQGALVMTDTDEGHTIYGSSSNDNLHGGGGNDTIQGNAGNDTLFGDTGIDTLSYAADSSGVTVSLALVGAQNTGGSGTDTISGFENLVGSLFNDILSGDANANVVNGMAGIDTISYSAAAAGVIVNLSVTAGQNTVGAGTDTISNVENIIGSAFDDKLTGSSGSNIIEGGIGNDIVNGGAGNDTVSYEHSNSGVSINLAVITAQNTIGAGVDTLSGFENMIGSAYNDTLTGDSADNVIEGGAGADILIGGTGNDTLSYERSSAAVTVSLALTIGQNTGGAGIDTVSGFESIIGSAYNDSLTGDAGNNTLEGGAGNDTLIGGAGLDRAIYIHAIGPVIVNLETGTASGEGNDTLSSIENVTGSGSNDVFISNSGSNIFDGGYGIDTVDYSTATSSVIINLTTGIVTGHGNDTLVSIENAIGSSYNDTITISSGSTMINGGLGIDTVSFAQALSSVTANLSAEIPTGYGSNTLVGVENITGSGFSDTLTGNAGVNIINGGAGDDALYGNGGLDTLTGGLGADVFVFRTETAFAAPITVSDFNLSQGDRLDISNLLEPFDPLVQVVTDFIQMTTNGSSTIVSIDTDGTGTVYGWQQIATLSGVTGLTDEATLIDKGNLTV